MVDKRVTDDQEIEFFKQKKVGRINRENLQLFLQYPDCVFGKQKEEILDFAYTRQNGQITMNIPRGMTTEKVFEMYQAQGRNNHFSVEKDKNIHKSLDAVITKNDRYPKEGYRISFPDLIEADEDLRDLSAYQLELLKKEDKGRKFITLFERLALGWIVFKETGKHLDPSGYTLCAGSRTRNGYVPHVFSRDGNVYVSLYYPSYHDDELSTREAIGTLQDAVSK